MASRRSSRPGMGRTNQYDIPRGESGYSVPGSSPPSAAGRVKALDLNAALPGLKQLGSPRDNAPKTFRDSREQRYGSISSRASTSGGRPGWVTDRRGEERLSTADNAKLENTVEEVRRLFRQKLATSRASVQDIFREADVHGEGSLGPVEFNEGMKRLGMTPNDMAVERLLQKHSTRGRMDLKDFNKWFDDSFGQMILATPPGGRLDQLKVKGDNRNAKHLYIPTRRGRGMVGRLNEVLEAEKIASGQQPPRLDSNFSSVQYDILSFSLRPRLIDERLRIPVKKRLHLFDNPPPLGRRVAYHHGDTPYDIVTVRTPKSKESNTFSSRLEAPVRLCTFSRIHKGDRPTVMGQELGVTQGIVL